MLFQRENFKKLLYTLEHSGYKLVEQCRPVSLLNTLGKTGYRHFNSITRGKCLDDIIGDYFSVAEEFRELYYIRLLIKGVKYIGASYTTDFNIRNIEESYIPMEQKTYVVVLPCVNTESLKDLEVCDFIEGGEILELEFYYAFKLHEVEQENFTPVKIMGKYYFIDTADDIHTWKYKFDKDGNMTMSFVKGITDSKNIKRFHAEPHREIIFTGNKRDVQAAFRTSRGFDFSQDKTEDELLKVLDSL